MIDFSTIKSWFSFLNISKKDDQYVIDESEIQAEIPESYARRFTLEAIQDPAQILGREDEIDWLNRAYENWKITTNPLIIAAHPGEGMSSLLNAASAVIPGMVIFENRVSYLHRGTLLEGLSQALGQENVTSFADLSSKIDEESQYVFVFENVERLFHRKVNGFKLLEEFLVFLHATNKNIFWILTINKYSKYYLDRAVAFSSNFPSSIKLKGMPDDLIIKSIEHRNLGYECIYLKPTNMSVATARKVKKSHAGEQQSVLMEIFNNQMLEFAEGNISRALLYWSKAVVRVKEKIVFMRVFDPHNLSELSISDILALESIHIHGSMSISEFVDIMMNRSKESQLVMAKLLERDLIIPKEIDNGELEYQINLFNLNEILKLFSDRLNRHIRL